MTETERELLIALTCVVEVFTINKGLVATTKCLDDLLAKVREEAKLNDV